jgi:hypothetical protein
MSDAPTDCTVGPSHRYALLCTLLHVGAALALLMTRLDPLLLGVLAVLLTRCAWRELCRNAWRTTPDAVRRVRVDARGWWLAHAGGAESGPLRVEASRVWSFGVLLVLRGAGRRRMTVLVPADAAPAQALRRLRVAARAALAVPPR